jgi:PAS domain S-box-containing protein
MGVTLASASAPFATACRRVSPAGACPLELWLSTALCIGSDASKLELTGLRHVCRLDLVSALEGIGDIELALEDIGVPCYVLDTKGVIRWVNPAAEQIGGDLLGRQFTSVVAPEDVRRARELFAQKVAGNVRATEGELVLVYENGERHLAEVHSVQLRRGGRVVGVFGQIVRAEEDASARPDPRLTPRQAEVLRLLERGRSTRQIAEELGVSTETVRNHVRHVLNAFGVRSRLEAVAVARREPGAA